MAVPTGHPRQQNGYDCGVFVLQYAESFFSMWPELTAEEVSAHMSSTVTATMFDCAHVAAKRDALLQLLKRFRSQSVVPSAASTPG